MRQRTGRINAQNVERERERERKRERERTHLITTLYVGTKYRVEYSLVFSVPSPRPIRSEDTRRR